MEKKTHPYHILPLSPWPILITAAIFFMAIGGTLILHKKEFGYSIFVPSTLLLIYILYRWWADVVEESNVYHTLPVQNGLKFGMSLFILSEAMFFFAFFFSCIHFDLFPVDFLNTGIWPEVKGTWPPKGTITMDPWSIPFMNTLILLLSGTTVTWAHYAILEGNQKDAEDALGLTVILGVFFTCMQIFEYHHAPFKFADNSYTTNFYLATGFHGLHVLIGTIFLAVCYFRAKKGHFSNPEAALGFEFAAWYWHFVDVIWLLLFLIIYIIGS